MFSLVQSSSPCLPRVARTAIFYYLGKYKHRGISVRTGFGSLSVPPKRKGCSGKKPACL
jgi:hypothetical protein